MRVLVVMGTRPEAIKLAPVIRALRERPDIVSSVCATAQHRQMLDQVLDAFSITPEYDLDIMTPRQDLPQVTSRVLEGVYDVLANACPDLVLVQGDTTTALASSLAAFYRRIPVGHVEAGLRTLRSYDPFPEEMNRRLIGGVASLHFAPGKASKRNLIAEGVSPEDITVTGNTVIDALLDIASREEGDDSATRGLGEPVILVTAHRRESLGAPLRRICQAVSILAKRHPDACFVYPVHPNPQVRETVHKELYGIDNVHLTEPMSYVPFVHLMKRSTLVLTDSGGIQEEAPALHLPVLILRDVTEREEAIQAGGALLVGTVVERIVQEAERLLADETAYRRMSSAPNPFGDGLASKRIVNAIAKRFGLPSDAAMAEFHVGPAE